MTDWTWNCLAHVLQTLDLNLQRLLRVVTKDERNNVPRLNMDPEYMRTEIQRSYTKQKVVISLTKKDFRDLRVLVPQIMIQNMQKYDIVIYRKLDLIGLKCDLLYEVAVWALA